MCSAAVEPAGRCSWTCITRSGRCWGRPAPCAAGAGVLPCRVRWRGGGSGGSGESGPGAWLVMPPGRSVCGRWVTHCHCRRGWCPPFPVAVVGVTEAGRAPPTPSRPTPSRRLRLTMTQAWWEPSVFHAKDMTAQKSTTHNKNGFCRNPLEHDAHRKQVAALPRQGACSLPLLVIRRRLLSAVSLRTTALMAAAAEAVAVAVAEAVAMSGHTVFGAASDGVWSARETGPPDRPAGRQVPSLRVSPPPPPQPPELETRGQPPEACSSAGWFAVELKALCDYRFWVT